MSDILYSAKPIICSYDGYQSMINEAQSGTFVKFGREKELADMILKYSSYPNEKITMMGCLAKEFILQNRTFDKLAAQYLTEIKAC